jgi:hypothetical protein
VTEQHLEMRSFDRRWPNRVASRRI